MATLFLILIFLGQIGGIYSYSFKIRSVNESRVNASTNLFTSLHSADNTYIIHSVPYHSQDTSYYCGPASLEMIFDFYGKDISQFDIANVARANPAYGAYTDDLVRAAHFSKLSTSVGKDMPGNITGYQGRPYGYGAFEGHLANVQSLINLINMGYPILVLQWFSTSHDYGHFRVVIGYVKNGGKITQIITDDPWQSNGPHFYINYNTFIDLWTRFSNWALFVCPWSININCSPSPPDVKNSTFNVNAEIKYTCPKGFSLEYPASLCKATIKLPSSISLVANESYTKNLNSTNLTAGEVGTVSWKVVRNVVKSGDVISVNASGIVSGYVSSDSGSYYYPAYTYTDLIGGNGSILIKNQGGIKGGGDISRVVIPITISLITAVSIGVVVTFIFRKYRVKEESGRKGDQAPKN